MSLAGAPLRGSLSMPASTSRLNVAIVLAIAAAGILSLWLEGYLSRVDLPFGLYAAILCTLAVWVAARAIPTGRLLRLCALAGAGSYATQYVGATLGGLWTFPPPDHTYYFAPPAFAIAALVGYGLIESLAPLLRRRFPALPRWLNPALVLILLAVVIVTSAPYRAGQGPVFWLYYGAMAAAALYYVTAVDTATMIALVVTAIVMGSFTEVLSAHSRLWSFGGDPAWIPPAWLILGSWPFELMIPVLLSASRRRR